MTAPADPVERDLVALFGQLIEGACSHGHLLTRYVAGDLPEAEWRAFERTLADCPHCQQDLGQFRTTDFSPVEVATARPGRVWAWGLRLAAATACVAVGCLVIWLGLRAKDDLRTKGPFQILVGAVHQGHQFPVTASTQLEVGDLLGFFYSSDRAGHLAVFYANPGGDVQALSPSGASESLPVAAGQNVRLADGAEVSPGGSCAWIIAVFSDRPFALAPVRETIRAASPESGPCAPDWSAAGRKALVERGFDLATLQLRLQS